DNAASPAICAAAGGAPACRGTTRFTFGCRFRLPCRAGDFARRTSANSKSMIRWLFFKNQRCGGVKTPPYSARQTLCRRETIGFFRQSVAPPQAALHYI